MDVWGLFKFILSLKIYFMLLTPVHRHRRRKVVISLKKQKWKKIVLTVVLIGTAVFLCLLLICTFSQATDLVDYTLSEVNLYSKYARDHYHLDFYVDTGWDWLPWN